MKGYFPVIAGRTILAPYYDVFSDDYCILFAAYSDDGTRYNYGQLGSHNRRSGSSNNYGVTEGAEYMSPTITGAIDSHWISTTETYQVNAYLIKKVKEETT